MKNVIGKKNNIYLIETLITTLLIIALIVLSIYRTVQNENGIAMLMVFIGLTIICLYFLFLEIKNIYKYLKSSKDIIQEDGEFIYIYEFKNFAKISINKIKEIKVVGVVKKILAHEASLYIKDEENEYYFKLIKDVEEVKTKLEELVNGISIY